MQSSPCKNTAMRRIVFIFLPVIVAMLAVVILVDSCTNDKSPTFRFAQVERGALVSTVSSTGTLNAVTAVQVGSQVSGQIKELFADFNSEVRKGQIIARIDPENFDARVRQADAELAVARANVAIQRASVEGARAELENARAASAAAGAQTEKSRIILVNAKRDLDRKRVLRKKSIISESQLEESEAAYDQAQAQLNTAQAEQQAQASLVGSREARLKMSLAQVEHALAQVKQREAALHNSKVDLEHTVIRSPLDGVVTNRSVDIGQTVAASLQAPTLFTIAQDLREMQVDTNVDEADIGRILVGQRVTFTVDAFPGEEFIATVEQIRKAPETIQNVVTYTVVVSARNQDQRLLPGMTANVQIVIDERQEVLKVPNAALRFRPSEAESVPVSGAQGKQLTGSAKQGERLNRLTKALKLTKDQQTHVRAVFAEQRERIIALRRQEVTPDDIRTEIQQMRKQSRAAISEILTPEQREQFQRLITTQRTDLMKRAHIWVADEEGKPHPIEIITGISDGSFTEIVRGDLKAGQQVIVGRSSTERRSSGRGLRRFGF
jgi:HlyD family secretion protein